MATSQPIADAAAREAALDPRRSFIVQAPAGSGKTELLVQRFITLLKTVEKPEEILAITFTIKAAAEMRKRVLEKIPNGPEIAHRLRIQTIDAFCAALTRQMPVLSRFGAAAEVLEDARDLYQEAAKRTLDGLSPPVARLLAHLDNNFESAETLIASMLARRDQWLRKTGDAPTRRELESSLLSERTRLLEKARALHPKASVEFAERVLTRGGAWRRRPHPAPRELVGNEPLRQALSALLRQPPERYDDAQWEVLGAILQLLPLAAAQLKVVFAERGQTDFTEVAQGAVRALGTPEAPTDLLLALDTRIRHILVDEFQDTSVSQWELLERLTAGWEKGDGRTLFLVGDPMQSIYRFREAEVGLFLNAWQGGLGTVELERLTLSTNFRSQAGLVSWFNASFPAILPREADRSSGAVPYSAATPHPEKPALPGDAATWHHVPDRGTEAQRIIDVLKNNLGRAAILVRTRDALAEIVPALKAEGIRYRAIEIERLGEKQVVQDLYAITRALLHLGDRIAWLSLLRAPWFGLSLKDLLNIAGGDRFKTIWELIKDDLFLERFTRILAPAIANRERGSLRERVEGVWLALGGPACVEDRTDLEDAEIFLDELDKLEAAGAVDLAALHESLERLYALPDVAATDDDLQIMTIHKAKGLEFDTVIVPGLDKGPGRSDPPLFLWKELVGGSSVRPAPPVKGGSEPSASGGLLLAPIKATGSDPDPTYDYLRDLDSEAEDTEASRLLYVAATRAKNHLHLLACLGSDDHGNLKKPTAHTLLARAWPVAEKFFSTPQPAAPAREAPAAEPIYSINRLAPDFRMPPLPEPARWAPPPEGRDEEEIEFSWAGETARHVGTVVHRWLQRIADDEMKTWDASKLSSLHPRFVAELQLRGVDLAQLPRAAQLVEMALKQTISDDTGRWLLTGGAGALSEYRLRVHTASGQRTRVVDRVLRDKTGQLWVIDFKTSRHEGTGTATFLARERERYANQLLSYRAALRADRIALYYPLIPAITEITVPEQ
jgi:ATP-dependent exoDNAse (exonuclease V) beta subunit